jgi:hypothetical protein
MSGVAYSEYHGHDGVVEFFSKLTSAIIIKSMTWELPYGDVTIGTATIELVTAGRFKRSNTNFTDHRQLIFLTCNHIAHVSSLLLPTNHPINRLVLIAYHDRINRIEWVDQEPSKIVTAYQTKAEQRLDAYHHALYRFVYFPCHLSILQLNE